MAHKYQDVLDDVVRIWEDNDKGKLTKRMYLQDGKYSEACVLRHFGKWSTLWEKIGQKPIGETKKLITGISQQITFDTYRDFQGDEVAPWTMKYEYNTKHERIVKVMVISDVHDLDHDEFTMMVWFAVMERLKPDIVVLNGDGYDCYEFSRYNKDPRRWDVVGRFNWMKKEFWARIRRILPDADLWFIVGNHEMRILKHMAEKDVAMMSLLGDFLGMKFHQLFGIDEYEVNFVCKSDLAAWTKTDWKKELRKNYHLFHDSWVAAHICDFGFGKSGSSGHTHTPSYRPRRSFEGPNNWTVTPGACGTDADYVERITDAQTGFGIVYIDTWAKRANQKLVITSDGFCEVGGEFYYKNKG